MWTIPLLLLISAQSCEKRTSGAVEEGDRRLDSLELMELIAVREKAMIRKDIPSAMAQFTQDVSWINSQGYFFEGRSEVQKFHDMLAGNDSLDYYYKAGNARVRILDSQNAMAYYSWKMFWFAKENPKDTINREIGLMTLTARKIDGKWKWVAITNQHTPWFYDSIEPVYID